MSAEKLIFYDGDKYRQGREIVKDAVRRVRNSQMSVPVQDTVLELMAQVAQGTLQSADAIHETLTAEEVAQTKRRRGFGGESDLATDKEGLKELPKKIKAGNFSPRNS